MNWTMVTVYLEELTKLKYVIDHIEHIITTSLLDFSIYV